MNHFFSILLFVWLLVGAGAASGQGTGIVAGQIAGMRVVHSASIYFDCDSQPPHLCHQLDVDGNGSNDFELSRTPSTYMSSLAPATWQFLESGPATGLVQSVGYAGSIDAPPAPAVWNGFGYLRSLVSYNGISRISGSWAEDTLTRYIGIRQLQNGQWRYGYLKTKRMVANDFGAPVYITAYAMQAVVSATQKTQLAGVEVYPNPAQSSLQITSPHAGRLRIYNAVGSLQHEERVTAGAVAVSVANWSSGMYLLRLENEQGEFTLRFQKSE